VTTNLREILLDVASEFEKLEGARLDRFLGYAVTQLGEAASEMYGTSYGFAVAYLAAHMLAIQDRGRRRLLGSSRVTSQSATTSGDTSVGFAPQLLNKLDADEALRATPYGAQFLLLRDALVEGMPLVITSSS
jgi:hypothetical protein